MQRSVLLWGGGLIVLAFSAGFAGHIAARQWDPPLEAAGKKAKKRTTSPTATDPLAARVRRLEDQLRALRQSQRAVASLTNYANALAEKDSNEEGTETERQPMLPVIDGEDPAFGLAVRSVMDQVNWERDEEQRVRREQRRNDRARSQTELLGQRLGLNEEQQKTLADVLAGQMQSFQQLRNPETESGAKRPQTRTEWRERVDAIRQATEERLSEVFSEEQLTGYQTFMEEESMWGRRRGRPTQQPPGTTGRGGGPAEGATRGR